ncbi:MAG: AAA family ATPase [Clostridia bacterium]
MDTGINTKLRNNLETLNTGSKFIETLSNESWTLESTQSLCQKLNIPFNELHFENYIDAQGSIKEVKCDDLLLKLSVFKNKLTEILSSSVEWGQYNENYKQYFISNSDNICNSLKGLISINQNRTLDFGRWASQVVNNINQLNQSINSNINEFIEQFKYGNKNYVVFGKNGSGKTTLLKKISSEFFKSNSVVVPANRNVNYEISSHISYNNNYTFNQMLSDRSNSLHYLARKMISTSLEQYENEISKQNIITKKFKYIFSSLSLERFVFAQEDKFLLSVNDIDNKYSLANASDGERTVVYMILAVLLSPENSFIFIDEPENHLNGALMRKLFDELELSRPDIRFIYLTHNTDFIESRKNTELIYLEKTYTHQTWKFNKIEDYSDLSLDIILNIDGMGSKILFCEGNDRSSIDSKILQSIYTEFEILPVGSCENVIENTKGVNGKHHIFKRKAVGIIDNDYRSDSEIHALKTHSVEVLSYNEWENLLLDIDIIDIMNSKLLNKSIVMIKTNIVTFIKGLKNKVVSDYLNKLYIRIIRVNKLSYNDNLASDIDQINTDNKTLILDEANKFVDLFDRYTSENNYDELIKIISGKFVIGTLAQELGLKYKEDIENKFVSMLKTDSQFKSLVEGKLNLNINEE